MESGRERACVTLDTLCIGARRKRARQTEDRRRVGGSEGEGEKTERRRREKIILNYTPARSSRFHLRRMARRTEKEDCAYRGSVVHVLRGRVVPLAKIDRDRRTRLG